MFLIQNERALMVMGEYGWNHHVLKVSFNLTYTNICIQNHAFLSLLMHYKGRALVKPNNAPFLSFNLFYNLCYLPKIFCLLYSTIMSCIKSMFVNPLLSLEVREVMLKWVPPTTTLSSSLLSGIGMKTCRTKVDLANRGVNLVTVPMEGPNVQNGSSWKNPNGMTYLRY